MGTCVNLLSGLVQIRSRLREMLQSTCGTHHPATDWTF